LDSDKNAVGQYENGSIEWASKKEYKQHKQKMNKKARLPKKKTSSDDPSTDDPSTDDPSTDDPSTDDPSTDDTSSDEELDSETESESDEEDLSEQIKELKTKIDRLAKKVKGGSKQETLLYQGGSAGVVLNKQFRGWGFTFR
jgi:hypothetical protein